MNGVQLYPLYPCVSASGKGSYFTFRKGKIFSLKDKVKYYIDIEYMKSIYLEIFIKTKFLY